MHAGTKHFGSSPVFLHLSQSACVYILFGRDLGLASMTSLDTASTCFHLSILQSFFRCVFSDRLCLVTLEIPAEIPSAALRGFVVVLAFCLAPGRQQFSTFVSVNCMNRLRETFRIFLSIERYRPILFNLTDDICLTNNNNNNLSDNPDACQSSHPVRAQSMHNISTHSLNTAIMFHETWESLRDT